jgi:hypothetical protein
MLLGINRLHGKDRRKLSDPPNRAAVKARFHSTLAKPKAKYALASFVA